MLSITKLNSQGDIVHPCLTPLTTPNLVTPNHSEFFPYTRTHASLRKYSDFKASFKLPRHHFSLEPTKMAPCPLYQKLSLGLHKSIIVLFSSIAFSPSCLTVSIWLMQLLLLQKVPCSSSTFSSVIALILLSSTVAYTFRGTFNRLIHR